MPPAARVGDMHTCPMQSPAVPPVPHVGGPIMPPGAVNVLIGGVPAAVVGALCTCVGPPDSIVKGSTTVLIGGRPAARMGDTTAHGGVVVAGLPTVMTGSWPAADWWLIGGRRPSRVGGRPGGRCTESTFAAHRPPVPTARAAGTLLGSNRAGYRPVARRRHTPPHGRAPRSEGNTPA